MCAGIGRAKLYFGIFSERYFLPIIIDKNKTPNAKNIAPEHDSAKGKGKALLYPG